MMICGGGLFRGMGRGKEIAPSSPAVVVYRKRHSCMTVYNEVCIGRLGKNISQEWHVR